VGPLVSRLYPILLRASTRRAFPFTALIGRATDALDRYLPALFAIVASPVLLFFALYLPAGQVPDEMSHILRADSLRHASSSAISFSIPFAIGPTSRRCRPERSRSIEASPRRHISSSGTRSRIP
jgi:hypothetical protein